MGHGLSAQFREQLQRMRQLSRNARLLLLALGLIGVGYGAFGTLFALYIIELGFDEGFLGRLVAVGAAAGALFSIPAGLVSDRIGAHRGLLIGMVVTAVGILIECTVTSAPLLIGGSLVAALGVTLVYVAQAPFIAANSSESERTYVYSLAAAMLVALSIVGSLLAGVGPGLIQGTWPALSTAAAYRATILLIGVISVGSLPVLMRLQTVERSARPLPSRDLLTRCLQSSAVRRLIGTGLLLALGGGLVVPFFTIYFQELGASTGAVGLIRAVGIGATVIGSLAAPWLAARFGLVGGVVVARLCSAPFLLLMGVSPLLAGAVAAFALRTFVVYLSDPLHTDFSMRVVPTPARATANSLTFMSWNLTLALGGWLGGRLIAETSYQLVFIIGSLITMVAASAYWLAFRRLAPTVGTFASGSVSGGGGGEG